MAFTPSVVCISQFIQSDGGRLEVRERVDWVSTFRPDQLPSHRVIVSCCRVAKEESRKVQMHFYRLFAVADRSYIGRYEGTSFACRRARAEKNNNIDDRTGLDIEIYASKPARSAQGRPQKFARPDSEIVCMRGIGVGCTLGLMSLLWYLKVRFWYLGLKPRCL